MSEDQRQPSTIVLLAHGPASDTLTAARRLEPFVADLSNILVVAAIPPGATAIDRAAERGFTTATDDTPLADVLKKLSGSVLVIHDDVSIDADSIEALCHQHNITGDVAVPSGCGSNDDPVDLVCAVGTAAQLAELATRAGFGPGMTVDHEFAITSNAQITHSATCQRRTTRPNELGRPLLVAALIVRDEEEQISECLASLEGVVDRIEVCDTGSLDRTVELAVAGGANVIEVDWRNDFAWARNQVLERCTDAAYMLWIDADERFSCEDPRGFREMLATYSRIYPSYGMNLHNRKADGTETHSFIARRIADPSVVRFSGAIHEQAVRVDGNPLVTAFVSNASIQHFGYDESLVDLRKKAERNLKTAQQGYEDDPSETNAVQLARALKGASKDPENTLNQLTVIHSNLTNSSETVRALMLGLEAELLLQAGRLDDAATAAKMTLDLVPADATAGAVLAEALRRNNRFGEIITSAADYAGRQSAPPLITDHVAHQTRARIIFETAIRLGDIEAARTHALDLPAELDPWPLLATHLSLDELLDMRNAASSADDHRFVDVVLHQHALDRGQLELVAEAFSSTKSPSIMAMVDVARRRLHAADQHVHLRENFDRSGDLSDAVAYARCLCAGQVELALELDDVDSLHDPTAAALSIAAIAHARRGNRPLADVDARESLNRWPGTTRSAIIIAKSCIDRNDPRAALETIGATREATHHDRLTRTRRHDLARLAAQAHLDLDDLVSAISEAAEVVEDDSPLRLWDRLLAAAGDDMNSSTLVLGLALLGDGVEFISALATSVAPTQTGQLCAAYLSLGGANPDAVSTGILAAVLAGQDELALVIAEYGWLLPDEIRSRLAQHLSETDEHSIAARLAAQTSASV